VTKFRLIESREVKFLIVALVWTFLWNLVFVQWLFSFFNANPSIAPPLAWLIHQTGYIIMFGLFGFVLFKELPHVTRFALGANAIFIALEIAIPPLCVSTAGDLLLAPGNLSCLAGNDTMVSWFVQLVGIPYGTPLMFYVTYIGGMMFFFTAAVLLLKQRELWQALGRNLK